MSGSITFNKRIGTFRQRGHQITDYSKQHYRNSNIQRGVFSESNIKKRFERTVKILNQQVKQKKIYNLRVNETEDQYIITYETDRR